MKSMLPRREFIGRLVAVIFTGAFLGGCLNRDRAESSGSADDSTTSSSQAGSSDPPDPLPRGSSFAVELEKNRKLPRELVMKLLDQKVDHYMQISHHCAQSSFLALSEQFGLEGTQIVKALTPVSGIAERGETCGAVTGPLMVFGLVYGRGQNQLGDWETYRESLIPSGVFCDRFEQEYGSTMCHQVQNEQFGRCFRLTDPGELAQFQESDATAKCSAVVRKAVRIAAGILLEDSSIGS